MGHSHGANVIFLATQLGVTMREAVLLSCPVHLAQYDEICTRRKVVSIRVHLDLVRLVTVGGSASTICVSKSTSFPVGSTTSQPTTQRFGWRTVCQQCSDR